MKFFKPSLTFSFFFILITALTSQAQTDNNAQALQQAQQVLLDSQSRQGALNTPEARAADRQAEITALGNGAHKQEIYGLAAALLPWLAQQGAGDPTKMAEMMERFQKDPQAFFNSIPADQREKIRALAAQIEAQKNSRPTGTP